jgi:hypothetical protein
MNCSNRRIEKSLLTILILSGCLFCEPHVFAQGKQAIVILKPGGQNATASCEGATEISYQLVYDLKLNNEDDVRLANGLRAGGSAAGMSRKEYEASSKSKLKDLYALKWASDGMLYAVSVAGQTPVPAVPDNMKPQKNADQSLSSFYSVMLSGEARDGKQKRKLSLTLREIWKIYFVPEGAAVNDTLFKHAVEEKSVALWEAFLKKTSNYRGGEANTYMRDALIECARTDLGNFSKGDYSALEKARLRAGRAQSVRNDEATRQLTMDIRQAQEKVDSTRNQVEQLIRADKWDDAINTAAPIKIYLGTWPDLNGMYNHALKSSHDVHLFEGEKALRANQLEAARENCTTAWQRLADSSLARTCVCESRNQIALRDSRNFRQQRHPKEAKGLLETQAADGDCPQDTRIATALRETNCEYAQQLLAESRQLVAVGGISAGSPDRAGTAGGRRAGRGRAAAAAAAPPPRAIPVNLTSVSLKPITAQNKKEFRDALAMLVLASQLCPDEAVRATLDATKRRLSEFCLEEARKAIQRGHFGTAYVYLQTAQGYTPDDGNVTGLLSQVRERFQQQARVSIGVVLENSARVTGGDQILSEVAAGIESVVSRAGLSQAIVLDRREAANAFRGIQTNRESGGPTIIFSGDLLGAGIRRSEDPRYVRSSYSYSNPRWEEADRVHDATNAQYKRCVRQSGEPACTGLGQQVASQRAYRDQFPRNVTEEYNYRETAISVEGGLRMSFRSTDSISRSTRAAETFSAAVNQQCVRREGVNPKDYSVRDTPCDICDAQSYLFQMVEKIKGDAYNAAASQLGAMPLSYYTRARSATNRQQGIEDYLRYLFLTRDKSGNEIQETQRLLVAFDPELSTDGILR